MKVLDVGCGWGSFAIHAAREHGVNVTGVTLSEAQASWRASASSRLGFQSRWRSGSPTTAQLAPSSYDAIASIGMAEHVGEAQIDRYAQSLFSLLRPGGILLNHAIATLDPDDKPLEDLFSTRYVFPDGETLALSRVQLALERAGFHTQHVEGFREDYAVTLQPLEPNGWTKPRSGAGARGAERTARVAAVPALGATRFRNEPIAVYQVRTSRPV